MAKKTMQLERSSPSQHRADIDDSIAVTPSGPLQQSASGSPAATARQPPISLVPPAPVAVAPSSVHL